MRCLLFVTAIAVALVGVHSEWIAADAKPTSEKPKDSVVRARRHSAPYSPHVYFPSYYYNARPWLHPQYVQPTAGRSAPNVIRRRRSTTAPRRPTQRYSIWDLSRRKRRSVDRSLQRRHKRQIDFYDGGNALSTGFAFASQRPRNAGRSPGIEQPYYESSNPYTAWDLSRRRRRRRRRQVQNTFDAAGINGDADATGGQLQGGSQTNVDRPPQYSIWDLARRRKREATPARPSPSSSVV